MNKAYELIDVLDTELPEAAKDLCPGYDCRWRQMLREELEDQCDLERYLVSKGASSGDSYGVPSVMDMAKEVIERLETGVLPRKSAWGDLVFGIVIGSIATGAAALAFLYLSN